MDSNLQPLRAPVFKTSCFPIRLPSVMAAQIGIEPITNPLTAGCSTVEPLCIKSSSALLGHLQSFFRERLERSTSFL